MSPDIPDDDFPTLLLLTSHLAVLSVPDVPPSPVRALGLVSVPDG